MQDILQKFSLKGKNVVITGGAGILGSVIAKGLGNAGASVLIADIVDTNNLVGNLQKEGIDARGYYMNVMDVEKIKVSKEEILKDFSQVDILVNAAGGNKKEATTSDELSFFDLPLDIQQPKPQSAILPNGWQCILPRNIILNFV